MASDLVTCCVCDEEYVNASGDMCARCASVSRDANERLRSEVASLRERAERLTVERDDLQAQTRRMFSAMASIKARRDEDRKKRRTAEERAERAERVLIPSLDCRYTGAGIADISGSHCPIEAPCQRCDLEREIRAAEAESASLRSALESIVTEWEKDLDGAEECFPLLERARAALSRRVPPGKEGT